MKYIERPLYTTDKNDELIPDGTIKFSKDFEEVIFAGAMEGKTFELLLTPTLAIVLENGEEKIEGFKIGFNPCYTKDSTEIESINTNPDIPEEKDYESLAGLPDKTIRGFKSVIKGLGYQWSEVEFIEMSPYYVSVTPVMFYYSFTYRRGKFDINGDVDYDKDGNMIFKNTCKVQWNNE